MEFAELIRTPKLDGVQLYEQLKRESIDGTLCITGHHLILSTRREGARELWLLHQNVDIVERKPYINNNVLEGGTIILKCKDLRIIQLRINSPQEYFNVSNSIEQLSNLEEIKKLYPFFYIPMYNRQKSSSATFLLFLDCVYQLFHQFPCSFEFDSRYLLMLFEHSYSSQYGTFLGDCERERKELKVRERTTSLWSHINRPQIIDTLLNPMYVPNVTVLWPSVAPLSIVLWADMYTRWVVDQSQATQSRARMQAIITEEKELEKKARRLRRELAELQREYQRLRLEEALLDDGELTDEDVEDGK
ncbi:hypothetical protein quinque_001087 [Culex quinquefasciatus]